MVTTRTSAATDPGDIELGQRGSARPLLDPAPRSDAASTVSIATDAYQKVMSHIAATSWTTVAKTGLIGGLLLSAGALGAGISYALKPNGASGGAVPKPPTGPRKAAPTMPHGTAAQHFPTNVRLSELASDA